MVPRYRLFALLAAVTVAIATPVLAQQARGGATSARADDKEASAAERKRVADALAKIGCKVEEVEKEGRGFEVDDARCDYGQYDIKLNGRYQITSMTRDAPSGTDADRRASSDETRRVNEAIAKLGCRADEVEKEDENLFEVDDARCDIGQYDIKLTGQFQIISITRD